MKLNTLIFPNGYTVDLNAAPRSADTGGNETMDPEGKVTGGGGKGKDVGTVATTTATGAGIGAIAGGAKGAGIGAGIGGLAGLGAILLTRGPEAELPARLHARHRSRTQSDTRRQSNSLQQRRRIFAHHCTATARKSK